MLFPKKGIYMELTDVKIKHQERIFKTFHNQLENRIRDLQLSEDDELSNIVPFYRHLLHVTDFQEYESIKAEFLTLEKSLAYPNMLKYLDHTYWYESKFDIILKLSLKDSKTLDILDIGTGTGHFPLLAQYFGHNVWGTNLPRIFLRPKDSGRHLYHVICDFFDLNVFELRVRANDEISGVNRRFDLITCLMTEFNTVSGKPWPPDVWDFFINDLKTSLLNPGGGIFLQLTNGKLTDESWTHLQSISEWSDEVQKYVFIRF